MVVACGPWLLDEKFTTTAGGTWNRGEGSKATRKRKPCNSSAKQRGFLIGWTPSKERNLGRVFRLCMYIRPEIFFRRSTKMQICKICCFEHNRHKNARGHPLSAFSPCCQPPLPLGPGPERDPAPWQPLPEAWVPELKGLGLCHGAEVTAVWWATACRCSLMVREHEHCCFDRKQEGRHTQRSYQH